MADYGEYGDFDDFDWEMDELASELELQKQTLPHGIDGIIFDVDGTLWDSRKQVAKAWNLAIKEHTDLDTRIDIVQLKNLFGKPMDEIAITLFPNLDEPARQELCRYCYTYEHEVLKQEPAPLYPGVDSTLKELSGSYPLFIASNCQCGYIEICIQSNHITPYIKDYACFGDTGLPKNETIRLLMERNNIKYPVYVGDTKGDEAACRALNIPIIYAAYGFGTVERPIATMHSFKDLLAIIPKLAQCGK